MNISPQSTPTLEDIKISFAYPLFDKIQGEPTYDTVHKLQTQATRNSTSVEIGLPPPHNNLAGIVEQPQVYLIRMRAAFP